MVTFLRASPAVSGGAQKAFKKLPDEVWSWESNDPIKPLVTVQPFAVVFPLPVHLGYIFSVERLIVAPLQGSVEYRDLYKIHNDAALQKVCDAVNHDTAPLSGWLL